MIRGLAIACAVLAVLLGVQTVRLADLKRDHAEQDSERYAQLTEALQADSDRAATHAATTVENANALRKAETERDRYARAAVVADGRMRNALRAYTDQLATLDAGTCHRAAATLGDLLGEALDVVRENTEAAERHADEVRVCLRQMKADRERHAVAP